jgi:phosphopantothenoylcysteine decarboxylase/phosphopantothenate--cysteine ligase
LKLTGKKILLGVTGSIAAYKSALLVRLLVKAGATVRVIMSDSATTFITPLTLATLSKNPVLTDFVSTEEGTWNNHVELGIWADAFVIAPATANTISKMANGGCDDLLTAVYLSARCPVFYAPAMDLDMFIHPAVRRNREQLEADGRILIPAANGELASGLFGDGRMAEPEEIVRQLSKSFERCAIASGKKVLITAGPTYEALDPVRFISNHSSGKMGYALAEAFCYAGAQVTLVSGPTSLPNADPEINLVKVRSAAEMYAAVADHFHESDLVVHSAAVADYTPRTVADQKIKKKESVFSLELTKTVDIASTFGKEKRENQLVIGFALETTNELENARNKLISKNLDYIVLNSLNDPGAGFAYDTNKVTVIDREERIRTFELKTKAEVASDILGIVLERWSEV